MEGVPGRCGSGIRRVPGVLRGDALDAHHRHHPVLVNANHNPGITFLGMSGGILALAMALLLVVCFIGPIVLCFGLGIIGANLPAPTPSWTPTP